MADHSKKMEGSILLGSMMTQDEKKVQSSHLMGAMTQDEKVESSLLMGLMTQVEKSVLSLVHCSHHWAKFLVIRMNLAAGRTN